MKHALRKMVCALVLATVSLGGGGVAAQESPPPQTKIGEEGFESPPATLEEMDWLIGQWSGVGIGGAPAMESWLPPMGGIMVGTFVQETADGEIMFTEHLYAMEEAGTVVLRLKHFNADLTGWEEKDDMLTFRLVAMEPCAAYFNALTLRCADPEKPGEGLIAAVRMQSGGELMFNFKAADHRPDVSKICSGVMTVNECAAERLSQSRARQDDYLGAAQARYAHRPEVAAAIRTSEASFEEYLANECAAVSEDWSDGGTARTAQLASCEIALLDQRTRAIWGNWLTFMNENDEPLRPEPNPTSF